jgi:amino acid permease
MMQSRASRGYQLVFALIYLLLLYSLMSAYTTQGASLITLISPSTGLSNIGVALPAIIFILVFSTFMYSYKTSDYANRFFVLLKFVFFVLAIVIMYSYIRFHNLEDMPLSLYALMFAWPTLLPSFGFQNIIPVIYEYQKGDLKSIKKSILIGSLCVLAIYIVWVFLALALIPQQGLHSYQTLFVSGNNTPAGFITEVSAISNSRMLETGLSIFINIAIITSFIGVGISLMHYIRDIFTKCNKNINNIALGFVCFIPPLIFTIFYPKGFILALQYAAIFAVIIFVYTPIFLNKERELKLDYTNIYAGGLGTLVILCQIANLCFDVSPFGHF